VKRKYVRPQVVEETKDIADITFGDLPRMPDSVRTAVEYVAHCAANHCELRNGQTALFWHLMCVVEKHLRQEVKGD